MFAEDPGRGERFALEAAGIHLDYSKNRIDETTIDLLVQLAEQSGLRERIDAMFRGERINLSEHRAVPSAETIMTENLDQLSVNTIRTLTIDAVQAANSGHPGAPMALAPLVYTLMCSSSSPPITAIRSCRRVAPHASRSSRLQRSVGSVT